MTTPRPPDPDDFYPDIDAYRAASRRWHAELMERRAAKRGESVHKRTSGKDLPRHWLGPLAWLGTLALVPLILLPPIFAVAIVSEMAVHGDWPPAMLAGWTIIGMAVWVPALRYISTKRIND
jgi:hypothetical protein